MDKQFTKVRAIFKPAKEHEHTLKEEVKQFIGQEFVMQYSWLMDEDEMYPGAWALLPYGDIDRQIILGWVPEFDLEIVEEFHKLSKL